VKKEDEQRRLKCDAQDLHWQDHVTKRRYNNNSPKTGRK